MKNELRIKHTHAQLAFHSFEHMSQLQKHDESIFDILIDKDQSLENLMKMDQVKNRPFLDLAFHLHHLAPLISLQNIERELRNEYIEQLKELKLEQIILLIETMAYCNFNSSLAIEQLLWFIGESKHLHTSFFEIRYLNRVKYEVKSISDNQFVREELKKKLKATPYDPFIYNCRIVNIGRSFLRQSLQVGNVRLMKWAVEKMQINQKKVDWACQNGYLEVFKCMHEKSGITPSKSAINSACGCNFLEVIKYMYERFNIKPTAHGANLACQHGHLDLVKYINETCNVRPTLHGVEWACGAGKLEVVKYSFESLQIKIPRGTASYAAYRFSSNREFVDYVTLNFLD
jgi:hypothetical protein